MEGYLQTSAQERRELIELLETCAAKHVEYAEAMGTKSERRAKSDWKRASDRMEVFAVGYLRKLIADVDTLLAEVEKNA